MRSSDVHAGGEGDRSPKFGVEGTLISMPLSFCLLGGAFVRAFHSSMTPIYYQRSLMTARYINLHFTLLYYQRTSS